MPSPDGRRYRIIVNGELGELLCKALEGRYGCDIEPASGRTAVVASVRDDSEFYGLLDRFEEFALHIVSITELA